VSLLFGVQSTGHRGQAGGGGVHLANFATAVSEIHHTQTSILAGQAAVDTAETELTAAEKAVADTEDALEAAMDTCTGSSLETGTPDTKAEYSQNTIPNDMDLGGAQVSAIIGYGVCVNSKSTIDNKVTPYNAAVVNLAAKQAAYDDALAAQFFTPPENLIAAQVPGWFQDPDLDSGDIFAAYFITGLNSQGSNGKYPPMPWPAVTWGYYIRGADAVTALLMRSNALNEWGNNPITGAQTDFVLTAPTKNFYTDFKYVYKWEPHLELISPMLANLVAHTPFGIPPFSQQFGEDSGGQSCDPVKISLWNRDELGTSSGVQPSPQLGKDLCWESNILYTGDESVLASKVGQHVDTTVITQDPLLRTNGWLNVGMAVIPNQYHPAIPLVGAFHRYIFRDGYSQLPYQGQTGDPDAPWCDQPGNTQCDNSPPSSISGSLGDGDYLAQLGMPYLGFAIKERGFGQAASYAALWDHSYLRDYGVRNAVGGAPATFIESILSGF